MSFTAFPAPSISFPPSYKNFVKYDPLEVEEKKKKRFIKRKQMKNRFLPHSKSGQSKLSADNQNGSMTDTHGSCSLDLDELVSPTATNPGSDHSFFLGIVLLQSIAMYYKLADKYLQVFSMNVPPLHSRNQITTNVVRAHWAEGTQIT
jgi:hypothetical protein